MLTVSSMYLVAFSIVASDCFVSFLFGFCAKTDETDSTMNKQAVKRHNQRVLLLAFDINNSLPFAEKTFSHGWTRIKCEM